MASIYDDFANGELRAVVTYTVDVFMDYATGFGRKLNLSN